MSFINFELPGGIFIDVLIYLSIYIRPFIPFNFTPKIHMDTGILAVIVGAREPVPEIKIFRSASLYLTAADNGWSFKILGRKDSREELGWHVELSRGTSSVSELLARTQNPIPPPM